MEDSPGVVKGAHMKIQNVPFATTDWSGVPKEEYPGETGTSFWKVFQAGDLRVRMVEYSANFKSDHFCPRGHVLLVLEGELFLRLKNGREHRLTTGTSFQAGDDVSNPHLAYSKSGATVFIVD
jgi:hypothetical protein